ncbi:hypothetical protein TrST_g434 [Triparma strigata]|uniref:Magnesium transporter n=1 Tax=Triparma strigata TaxID=1606541 RepID=A0A9W7B3Q3_9STRA|nr:hypothetical protein TrST_g434 [Triparma strigata]
MKRLFASAPLQGLRRGNITFFRSLTTTTTPFARVGRSSNQLYSVIHVRSDPVAPPNSNFTSFKADKVVHVGEILRRSPSTNSHIHVRDLLALNIQSKDQQNHTIDYRTTRKESAIILPRASALLINFGHVKAISWKDEAFLFDSFRPDVQLFSQYLDRTLLGASEREGQAPAPMSSMDEPKEVGYGGRGVFEGDEREEDVYVRNDFELTFLEGVLREVCDTWHRRIRLYRPVVDGVLGSVSSEVDAESGMHRLVPLKDSLQLFEMEVSGAIKCLVGLLENDEDMLGLLLTEKHLAEKENKEIDPELHGVVELLLEDYNRQLDQILQEITYLQRRVQTKQELVAISLDSYRNRMIRMNVHIGIATMCLGICTTVAGYFGMNLTHGLEEHETAFMTTVVASGLGGAILYAGCHSYLSGSWMRERARGRAEEVLSVTGVLSHMNSLDYAVKRVIELKEQSNDPEKDNELISRPVFEKLLRSGRAGGKVTKGELDLIYEILDHTGDGVLEHSEFDMLDFELRKNQNRGERE